MSMSLFDDFDEVEKKTNRDSILVIDTFGYLFKSYYALPPLHDREGNPTNLLTGFVKFFNALFKKRDEKYIVFALEGGNNFRKELNSDYKSNRGEAPDDFKFQVSIILGWIEKMGFKTIASENFEADDVIASLSKFAEQNNLNTVILSQDKDFMQLLNSSTSIFNVDKDIEITEEECLKQYKIKASQFVDYQALIGDTIDNIKGVKGIGKVTAEKLLNQFESIEDIYSNLDKISNKRTAKLLETGKESAFESKKLAKLNSEIFTNGTEKIDFSDFENSNSNPFMLLIDDFIKYDIDSILQEFIKNKFITKEEIAKRDKYNVNFEHQVINTVEELSNIENRLKNLSKDVIISFDTETESVAYLTTKIVGFSFAWEENSGFYVPLNHKLGDNFQDEKRVKEFLKFLLFDFKIVGQNIKFDMHVITNYLGLKPEEIFSPHGDTMVLAWLMNSEQKLSLDDLSYKYIKHKMIKFKDIVQSSKQTFADIDLKIASKYAVEDAVITLKLYNYFIKFFIENNQNHILELAYKLEFPFVKSLYLMEQNGINIDIDFFQNLKEKLSDLIAEIKHKIYEISGTNFNLNSPKQISEVLFEQLDLKQHLPKKKKLSTNEATLQLLRDKHEIINLILDYREKHKLLSTYIEPFTQFDDKVHSSFWQTGTATGRLSSREPNLQNIPRNRTDINIREGFVVSNKQNKSFISIDYSQIELRFLAHFTEEPFLIEAFTYNLDVHNFVARKVFDIPESNEVSEEQRNMAKTVNYGLIYGMGASKLATTLKIDKQQASEILEKYFEQFEKISQFIQTVSDKIEEQNYIETILKRRRYFSEATSNRDFESNKREGFNAILQGSVADLIKQSMLEIVQKIESDSLNVKLILQIHDELLFEVDDKNIEEYSSLFKNIMEKSLSLKVPLKANIKISKNWSFV